METIGNKIVNLLDTDKTIWSDIERMQMVLGLQILIHNIIMTGTILFSAVLTDMFWEAAILLTTYGALKMLVGGIHFQTSSACLIGTETFVVVGVIISQRIDISLISIFLIFAVCFVVLMIIGPQGTENNPISADNYEKLRKKVAFIIFAYLIITFFLFLTNLKNISYLLMIAVLFETFSIVPSFIKSRSS